MSTFATTWAWSQTELDPPELLTLLALAEGANHQGQCWPSKVMLTGMTSMSEHAVAACLKQLESKGVLRREAQNSGPPIVFLALDRAAAVLQAPPKREVAPFVPSADVAGDIQTVLDHWNAMAARTAQGNPKHRIPAVKKLNDANRKKLAERLKEFGVDGLLHAVGVLEKSAHCRGATPGGWRADITYLLQPKGSMKLVNDGYPADYEEVTNGGQRTGASGRGEQRLDGLRGFDAAARSRLAQSERREGGG